MDFSNYYWRPNDPNPLVFRIDVPDDPTGVRHHDFPIRQVIVTGRGDWPSSDQMLLLLEGSVPAEIAAPMLLGAGRINTVFPRFARQFGYGCNPREVTADQPRNWNKKRYTRASGYWGDWYADDSACVGDSGGPLVRRDGTVVATHVGGERVALVDRERILLTVAAFDRSGDQDIRRIRPWGQPWCHTPEDVLYFGDLDADGDLDALCHNRVRGWRFWAENRFPGPFIVQRVDFDAFCNEAGDRLLVGDFDGDRRMDLYCDSQNRGQIRISPVDWGDRPRAVGDVESQFCRGRGRLHIGDFDGDGKSDRLCQRSDSGGFDIDINVWSDNRPNFDRAAERSFIGRFCDGSEAELHIAIAGASAANVMADLVCYEKSIGAGRLLRDPFVQFERSVIATQEQFSDFCRSPEKHFVFFGFSGAQFGCVEASGFGIEVMARFDLSFRYPLTGRVFPDDAFGPGRRWPIVQRSNPRLQIISIFRSWWVWIAQSMRP